MWLWELKNLAVIGISVLLSIVILTQTKLMLLLVASALYAFLSMRFDGTSILDFIKYAATFFFLKPQKVQKKTSFDLKPAFLVVAGEGFEFA